MHGTGQAPVLFQMPKMIDSEAPDKAKKRIGFDGKEYELVFNDEFNKPGRTFYPGDDPFWEAVDLWYGVTADLEWHDPQQVTTRDGALIITMDSADTTQSGIMPNGTAPFTLDKNHGLKYCSGIVQTWNKFYFTTGYIEVAVILPGAESGDDRLLARRMDHGQPWTTGISRFDGCVWPYTYDTCSFTTFPNQTYKDLSGPAAALFSDKPRPKNDNRLSWLPRQRLSACTCPGEYHYRRPRARCA
jgi:beta-glucanase (GH16 family)